MTSGRAIRPALFILNPFPVLLIQDCYERSALHHGSSRVCPDILRAVCRGGGLPFPAAIALVAAGAAVAAHTLSWPGLLLACMIALMIGDVAQFWLGRYAGWALLGFLCRLSMNPETCILSFGRIVLQAR